MLRLLTDSLIYKGCFLFFLFFQAEDGIRDKLVTGVQTCALPILRPRRASGRARTDGPHHGRASPVRRARWPAAVPAREHHGEHRRARRPSPRASRGSVLRAARSEERRVGKECRSGWSPYQYKEKV